MGDYDRDGFLDIFMGEWRPTLVSGPTQSRLLRNQGVTQPGHFTDTTDAEEYLSN